MGRQTMARWAVCLTLALTFAGSALAEPERQGAGGKLRIGQSFVFSGGYPIVRMRFTLLEYVDPVHSPLYRPAKGTKFVAFRLRIANLSAHRWQGTVASWAELIDTRDRVYDVTTPQGQAWPVLAPTWNGGTTIEGKESRVAYLGWVLPLGVKLTEFRYNLELGYYRADWVLPRR